MNSISYFVRCSWRYLPLVAFFSLSILSAIAEPVSLTGVTGKKVVFASVKQATPKGITAHMAEDGPLMGIPWDKLDLEALKREHPLIFAAYQKSQDGDTINLETFSDTSRAPQATVPGPGGRNSTYPGWFDTSIAGVTYVMQLPIGEPRGILFVGQGDEGYAATYLLGNDMGSGPFASLQTKFDLALMSYQFSSGDRRDPDYVPDFIFAKKGSGAALLKAIGDLAIKTKKESLLDAPIAMFGAGKVGGGFVYNFVQWAPERVMAAVVSKGAFYDGQPTEASAKVPMLFIWGQYSNAHEIWGSENSAQKVLAEYASMTPNWTNGMEFRGTDEMNIACQQFGIKYLESMLEYRMPEKVEKKPEPEPEESEPEKAAGEGKDSEGEKKEAEPEKPPLPVFKEIERANGYVGTVKSGEAIRIKDPKVPVGEKETFVPGGEFVSDWKKFVTGQFVVHQPKPSL